MSQPGIIVVGAGIVGACVAWHLARRGARVTLVDRDRTAGGVTSRSFGWINVCRGVTQSHAPLRREAIPEYHRLERELGRALPVRWSGVLSWSRDPAETDRFVRACAAGGHDVRLVGRAEIAALEPRLKELPDCAAFAASEGAVDPNGLTRILVRAAGEAGADLRLSTAVDSLFVDDHRVVGVRTGEGTLHADIVVLAAGTGAGPLAGPVGVPLPVDSSPAILLGLRTTRRLARTVLSTPHMEVRQAGDAVMLCAEDYLASSGDDGPDAVAQRAVAEIRRRFDGGDDVALESVQVADRPIPRDELPIVGFAPQLDGLYVTVMHAGVTLAPAVARLASTEILDDVRAEALEPCRVARFQAEPNRP